jgi:hypothetical protein
MALPDVRSPSHNCITSISGVEQMSLPTSRTPRDGGINMASRLQEISLPNIKRVMAVYVQLDKGEVVLVLFVFN